MRWECVGVVPQRVEGLYLRLRRVSICSMRRRGNAMGGFYWGSALLLYPRSLILTQVAAMAVWYQPVPRSLRRLQVLAESFCPLVFMWGLKYLVSLFPTFVCLFRSCPSSLSQLAFSGAGSHLFLPPFPRSSLVDLHRPRSFRCINFWLFFVFIRSHLVWSFCSFSPTVSCV